MNTYFHMCTYIPKYTPLQLYNVTCICVFRAAQFALGNQLVCFSLVRATSFTPSFAEFPIVLCVGVRPHEFFPVLFVTFNSVTLVQLLFRQIQL